MEKKYFYARLFGNTHATERTSAWWSIHRAVCQCVNLHCLPEMRQSGSWGRKEEGIALWFPPPPHVFSVVVCRWRKALSREFSFFKLIFFLGCSSAAPWSRKNTHLTSFWRDGAISWRANVTYCVVERRASLGRRHRAGAIIIVFYWGGGSNWILLPISESTRPLHEISRRKFEHDVFSARTWAFQWRLLASFIRPTALEKIIIRIEK